MPKYRVILSDTIEAETPEQAADLFIAQAESGEYSVSDCDVDEYADDSLSILKD